MIEKHFSLDSGRPGFDHKISLNVAGFKEMIERVRAAEKMMGTTQKEVSEAVNYVRTKYLRSVVATRSIMKILELNAPCQVILVWLQNTLSLL